MCASGVCSAKGKRGVGRQRPELQSHRARRGHRQIHLRPRGASRRRPRTSREAGRRVPQAALPTPRPSDGRARSVPASELPARDQESGVRPRAASGLGGQQRARSPQPSSSPRRRARLRATGARRATPAVTVQAACAAVPRWPRRPRPVRTPGAGGAHRERSCREEPPYRPRRSRGRIACASPARAPPIEASISRFRSRRRSRPARPFPRRRRRSTVAGSRALDRARTSGSRCSVICGGAARRAMPTCTASTGRSLPLTMNGSTAPVSNRVRERSSTCGVA